MTDPARPASGAALINPPLRELHLADTSAWSKARNDDQLAIAFDEAVRAGLIATCDLVALELLRSARNRERFTHQRGLLKELPNVPIGTNQLARAREVQDLLAAQGRHRGVKPADLVIAAAAEAAALPILHDDHDYDLIASVTDQPTGWLAPEAHCPDQR